MALSGRICIFDHIPQSLPHADSWKFFKGPGRDCKVRIFKPNVQAAEFEVTDTSPRGPEPLRQSLIDFFPRNRAATVNRAVFSSCYMSSEEAKDVGFGAGATQRALGNAESVSLQQIRTPGITCPG
jgi:hypothetical protein